MPEGPEIRRIADRLGRQLVGRRLDCVWFAFEALKPEAQGLVGQRVSRIDSWGKALLTYVEDGRVLYSHNQLYGRWKLHRAGRGVQTARSLRVYLEAEGRNASLYSASDVSLWHAARLGEHPFLSRLGPDLLTHGVCAEALAERLTDRRWRGRRLGGSLLDQGLVAGIGNYLRSEILFFAGVSHRLRPSDLEAPALHRLATAMVDVTHQAYRLAGVTNRDHWVEKARQSGASRRGWRFAVFERDGQPCHACGTTIRRDSVASRRLYYCPTCQCLP